MNHDDAYKLWDIEVRIRELQHELDHLHDEKSKLLGEKYENTIEYTSKLKDGIEYICD